LAESSASARLERDTGTQWEVAYHPGFGTARFLSAKAAVAVTPGLTRTEAALTFIDKNADLFGLQNAHGQLVPVRESVDARGNTHVRLTQHVQGVKVLGGDMIVHFDARGQLRSLGGRLVPGTDSISITPRVSAERAIDTAVAHYQSLGRGGGQMVVPPSAALVIVAEPSQSPFLAQQVTFTVHGGDYANMVYAIDAQTGSVKDFYNNIQNITGTGIGVLGDTKTLQIDRSGTQFALIDRTRTTNPIETFDASGGFGSTLVKSTNQNAWDTTGQGKGSAVDAHFYAGDVFDYYKQVHNRNSIDDNGLAIHSTVHVTIPPDNDNAFWDPQALGMFYADGDGTTFRPFAGSLDVIGHEMTHGVTQFTSGLGGRGENGGLNEGTSDVFGSLIEHHFKPDPVKNFEMGEDLSFDGRAFRDAVHPKNSRPPLRDNFADVSPFDDPHISMGVVINAYFLMTAGGSNDTSGITVKNPLGFDKSEQMWYLEETQFLHSSAGFPDMANAQLSAAKQLFGDTAPEVETVRCAWIATSVLQGTCHQ
jgi:Zn-dependent metalloprotease